MWRAVKDYHRNMPKQFLLQWLTNLRSFLHGVQVDGQLMIGSGCSGTDIWGHCLVALLCYWGSEFGLDVTKVTHGFAAENVPEKQAFLQAQFDLKVLVGDVEQLKDLRVMDVKTQSTTVLPWVATFGSGFACKGNSKQNTKRKDNKGCIRKGETVSGKTFEATRAYICRARPYISFLENVPEIQEKGDCEDTGLAESDLKYIIESFEAEGFVVIAVCFNARDYGSAAERVRYWFVVFDIRPEYGTTVKSLFQQIFNNLKLPQYPIEEPPRFGRYMHPSFTATRQACSVSADLWLTPWVSSVDRPGSLAACL
jgi:site-specific DNA-cytosine methylase